MRRKKRSDALVVVIADCRLIAKWVNETTSVEMW